MSTAADVIASTLEPFALPTPRLKMDVMKVKKICCIGAGYVGGPTMAVRAPPAAAGRRVLCAARTPRPRAPLALPPSPPQPGAHLVTRLVRRCTRRVPVRCPAGEQGLVSRPRPLGSPRPAPDACTAVCSPSCVLPQMIALKCPHIEVSDQPPGPACCAAAGVPPATGD